MNKDISTVCNRNERGGRQVSLAENDKCDESKKLVVDLAKKINPDYPDTLRALVILREKKGELQEANYAAIEYLKRRIKRILLFKLLSVFHFYSLLCKQRWCITLFRS